MSEIVETFKREMGWESSFCRVVTDDIELNDYIEYLNCPPPLEYILNAAGAR